MFEFEFEITKIIPNVDIKKGKNSQFFGEITLKAIPAIYSTLSWVGSIPSQSDCHDMRRNITWLKTLYQADLYTIETLPNIQNITF